MVTEAEVAARRFAEAAALRSCPGNPPPLAFAHLHGVAYRRGITVLNACPAMQQTLRSGTRPSAAVARVEGGISRCLDAAPSLLVGLHPHAPQS